MFEEQAQAAVSEESAETSTAATEEQSGTETGETAAESATAEEQDENEQGEQQGRKHEGGFQKRIRKLSERVTAAEQEREYWRQQALRTQQPDAQRAPEPAEEREPKPEQFRTYDEFVTAKVRYEAKQLVKAQEAERETARVRDSWNKQVEAGRTKHDDFDEVVNNPHLPISQPMAEVIQQSDIGADLAYYLGTHEDEAAKIARMSPLGAARELGRIEARLATPKPAAKTGEVKPAAPPVTRAPKPPTPVRKASPNDDGALRDDLPPEEWKRRFLAKMNKG